MGGLDVGLHRKHLELYRVGVKNLSRRDEYQVSPPISVQILSLTGSVEDLVRGGG